MVLKRVEEKRVFKLEEVTEIQVDLFNTAEFYDADAEEEWDEEFLAEEDDSESIEEVEDSDWVDEDSTGESEEKVMADIPEKLVEEHAHEESDEEEMNEQTPGSSSQPREDEAVGKQIGDNQGEEVKESDNQEEEVKESDNQEEEEEEEEEGQESDNQEEEDQESEFSDYVDWRKEKVGDQDPNSIFYIRFDGLYGFVQLLKSEFPTSHLISAKSTLVSPTFLPLDILNRNFNEDSDFDDAVENKTEESTSEHDSNVSFTSTTSLFDHPEVPVHINPPNQPTDLVVQLVMDHELNPRKLKKYLKELNLDFKSTESWFRENAGDKPSTFMISFKESYDFVRFLEKGISFPLDSIISIESAAGSPTTLPKDILTYENWNITKTMFQRAHLVVSEIGFTTPEIDLRIKLVMEARINPNKMERFLEKSPFVASYRWIRTLCTFGI